MQSKVMLESQRDKEGKMIKKEKGGVRRRDE
jgi:hypothetical protein